MLGNLVTCIHTKPLSADATQYHLPAKLHTTNFEDGKPNTVMMPIFALSIETILYKFYVVSMKMAESKL